MAFPITETLIKGELSICADPSDKHAFRFLRTRRVDERPLNEPGSAAPDLVIFQVGQDLGFADTLEGLPPQLWTSAQQGAGKVVFDASTEGKAHDPASTDLLHAALRRAKVPIGRGVYITQNRQYADDYRAYCRASGLSQGMRVVVYDYWIRRVLSEFEQSGPKVLEQRLEAFRQRAAHRPRRFLSLNFTPRPARLLFLTSLMQQGLWDQGFVSFGGFEQMKRRKDRSFAMIRQDFLKLPGFEDKTAALAPRLDQLAARGRSVLGDVPDKRSYQKILRPADLAEYHRSWFSVVTETEMLNLPARITEKALKPLLNLHPFIMFANPGSLDLVRGLGFETFPELVDESYDQEPEPSRRFELAFAELRRLCQLDEPALARTIGGLEEKLEFNAAWGLTRLPQKYALELDEVLLADVLAMD